MNLLTMQQKVGDSRRLSSVWLYYGPHLSDTSKYFENTVRTHISLKISE